MGEVRQRSGTGMETEDADLEVWKESSQDERLTGDWVQQFGARALPCAGRAWRG